MFPYYEISSFCRDSVAKKTDESSEKPCLVFVGGASALATAHNLKWVLALGKWGGRQGCAALCYATLYPESAGTLHVDSLR